MKRYYIPIIVLLLPLSAASVVWLYAQYLGYLVRVEHVRLMQEWLN